MENLKNIIRDVPDFPKPGILFKDIAPLLQNKETFHQAIDAIAAQWANQHIDVIAGIEARGFLFAAALAYKLGAGVVMIRKPGKLPYKTYSITYQLEYGTDSLEIHQDAVASGQNVLIVDDVLATGGTMKAVIELLQNFNANICGLAFLAELAFLNGREKLSGHKLTTLMTF
ncbi:adenine phosphoribosyltransferase [Candidatus Vecturithrix granuli]|uniref:Adenine phosphoribosyltransferase n=1 Tax=Vecturithrix granuli TaxID=1499967 RepID=A0A081C7X2_VECG1|nr:adenine phosphoribosyltransferase [Candidatus Vecturithrix granuli]